LPTVQVPGQSASSAAKEFFFAEDRLAELARLLGIPDGPAVDSYRYLVKGEGSPGYRSCGLRRRTVDPLGMTE
jgi:hypothetical protein